MTKAGEKAKEYADEHGNDCVRVQGGPGECIYNFCGCEVIAAYLAGVEWGRADMRERAANLMRKHTEYSAEELIRAMPDEEEETK